MYALLIILRNTHDRMFHFPYLREGMPSLTSLVRRYTNYILFCCPTNIATSNYGPCMEMETHVHTGPPAPVPAPAHETLVTSKHFLYTSEADLIFGTYTFNVYV